MDVVFLISPFSAATAGGEDPATYSAVQSAITEAGAAAGVELVRADDIFSAGVVIEQVKGRIQQADAVIAVCTGRNANVFYEVAIAESYGHQPILVAASTQDLPFDVAHWRAQLYAGDSSLDDLAHRLERAITETLAERRPAQAFRRPPAADTPPVEVQPISLVRNEDLVGFNEEAKSLFAQALEEHRAIGEENFGVQPTQAALDGFAEVRFSWSERILSLLAPAAEYQPGHA